MLTDFLHYLAAERRYSPLTVRNYKRDVERFVAWWCAPKEGPRPFRPTEVMPADISQWVLCRSEEGGLNASSMNRELSSLRAYFRFLRRQGVVEQDLFTHPEAAAIVCARESDEGGAGRMHGADRGLRSGT